MLEDRLRPYKCRMVQALPSGVEIWVTGWNQVFTLTPESDDKRYDEWQYRTLLATVIAQTMPSDWDLDAHDPAGATARAAAAKIAAAKSASGKGAA